MMVWGNRACQRREEEAVFTRVICPCIRYRSQLVKIPEDNDLHSTHGQVTFPDVAAHNMNLKIWDIVSTTIPYIVLKIYAKCLIVSLGNVISWNLNIYGKENVYLQEQISPQIFIIHCSCIYKYLQMIDTCHFVISILWFQPVFVTTFIHFFISPNISRQIIFRCIYGSCR